MKSLSRSLLSRALLFAITVTASGTIADQADAGCHGRSGGRVYSHHVRVYSPPRVVYAQPVFNQPVYAPPAYPATPVYPQPVAPAVSTQAPQTPLQFQNPFAAPETVPQANSGSAEQSALQALGGFAPPTEQPAPQQAAQSGQQVEPVQSDPGLSGIWTASLSNGASVRLTMTAEGSFEWIATSATGGQSSFQGQFAVSSNQLSLTRSGDQQQLSGTLTRTGADTFSFQLSTSNAAKLDFRRS